MNLPIIYPTTLSLLTTMYCTAQCLNCCFQCSPKRKERMSFEDIKFYIDKTVSLFPTIQLVVFSGGESFSLKEDLIQSVQYATNKKLSTRIVTNGFWAISYKKAYSILKSLKEAGLHEINFSTGDDHQEWVQYDNIVYGCLAARSLGINALVNIETHPNSTFGRDIFEKDERIFPFIGKEMHNPDHIKIMQGVWLPFDENTKKMRDAAPKSYRSITPTYKSCETMFHTISLMPNGDIYSCCGLTCLQIPYLRIGNMKNSTVQSIISNQFDDVLKIWLRTEGPVRILEFLYKNSPDKLKQIDYSKHICEVCRDICVNRKNIEKNKREHKRTFA